MVLVRPASRSWSLVDDGVRLDRATGIALAVAVNALMLVALSLPGTAPEPPVAAPAAPEPRVIEAVIVPRTVTLAPSLPAAAPVAERQRPRSELVRPSPPALVFDNPVLPLPPIDAASASGLDSAHAGDPLAGGVPMQLRVLAAPPPRYPPIAVREGREGTVVLKVLVGGDGRALRVEVEQGSGHRILDTSARTQVLSSWRFEPAQRDGRPVAAWARVPVAFSLSDG